MGKKSYLFFLILQSLFSIEALASSSEIMELYDIKTSITKCTTCDCQDFSIDIWYFQESITEKQYSEFIDAMYSLEHRTFVLHEEQSIELFNNISYKKPFCHPQLLGEW